MSTYEADDRVTDFRTQLSARARRDYASGGQLAHAHLVAALNRGWTPKQLARTCSRDLPTGNAWTLIHSRLEHCAQHDPPTGPPSAAPTVGWCGKCSTPTYRWIVDAEDRPLRPCPNCSPQRNQLGAAS